MFTICISTQIINVWAMINFDVFVSRVFWQSPSFAATLLITLRVHCNFGQLLTPWQLIYLIYKMASVEKKFPILKFIVFTYFGFSRLYSQNVCLSTRVHFSFHFYLLSGDILNTTARVVIQC